MSSESTFWLIHELQTAVDTFGTAASDPISAVLIAIGGLLTTGAILAFGALTAGAILDAIADAIAGSPPPAAGE